MSKATVTRLFIGSLIAALAGAILVVIAVSLAYANGVFQMAGSDVVGVQGSPLAWSLLGIGVVGGLAIAGGAIGGLVSWIGALLNTAQLEQQDVVPRPAAAGDLQPRVPRDDRVRDRWPGRHDRRDARSHGARPGVTGSSATRLIRPTSSPRTSGASPPCARSSP